MIRRLEKVRGGRARRATHIMSNCWFRSFAEEEEGEKRECDCGVVRRGTRRRKRGTVVELFMCSEVVGEREGDVRRAHLYDRGRAHARPAAASREGAGGAPPKVGRGSRKKQNMVPLLPPRSPRSGGRRGATLPWCTHNLGGQQEGSRIEETQGRTRTYGGSDDGNASGSPPRRRGREATVLPLSVRLENNFFILIP